ncbi:unnamed protein product [Meloidogyne enterolobii]|uniref:Uncharacterized protein n=3 Tax=Meloidogyne enterolobii TaxID=390850 RepID=A0A6V7X175_MELEN|nr:unnamed protein product [Meloidogyne enterolobii]
MAIIPPPKIITWPSEEIFLNPQTYKHQVVKKRNTGINEIWFCITSESSIVISKPNCDDNWKKRNVNLCDLYRIFHWAGTTAIYDRMGEWKSTR